MKCKGGKKKLRNLRNNNEAAFSYFVLFAILLFFMITLFALFIPMATRFNAELISFGEQILNDNQEVFDRIQNLTIRNQLQESNDGAIQSLADQNTILDMFVQYFWVIILVVITLVIMLRGRRNVEVGIH